MLKHGQIKFTKKAAQFAEEYFKKKKIETFLVAIKRSDQKPSGYKGLYKQLLGEKQDPSSTYKVYTNNIGKAKKLFETLLMKESRLSCILSPKFDCLLYLSKDQQDKFKKIISPDTDFPEGLLNEAKSDCITEFERKMNKTSSVDLADLILGIQETKVEVKSDIKKSHEKMEFKYFDVTVKILEKWIEYYKNICNITGGK